MFQYNVLGNKRVENVLTVTLSTFFLSLSPLSGLQNLHQDPEHGLASLQGRESKPGKFYAKVQQSGGEFVDNH
jgi:hypothetical protein